MLVFLHHAHALFGQFPPLPTTAAILLNLCRAIRPPRMQYLSTGYSTPRSISTTRPGITTRPPVFKTQTPLCDPELLPPSVSLWALGEHSAKALEQKLSNLEYLFLLFFLDCYDILEASVWRHRSRLCIRKTTGHVTVRGTSATEIPLLRSGRRGVSRRRGRR